MKLIMGCMSPDTKKKPVYLNVLKEDIFTDEYKVLCKIGEGSFSEVLKCVDKQSGVNVAAKQLKKSFRSPSHAEEMPELIALRKLTRHKNILHLFESHFDKETGRVTLVFELMDMSLYDVIKNRKKPVSEAKAKHYLYQIVKGVDHIHHHGIFHRDLKPENILVKGDLVKIADLGSIKGLSSQQPYTEYISTRWYRSPECLLTSGFYGPKMDVWAIGCVFFEILTLKPLFPGASEVDQIAKIHSVLGTPNNRLLAKFKRHQVRNFEGHFPSKQGTGLDPLIPFISDNGRDIMKQMIVYDPENRINIRRLSEHKYFADLRQDDMCYRSSYSCTSLPQNKTSTFLSYLTSAKNRRSKLCLQEDPKKTQSNYSSKLNIPHGSMINVTEEKKSTDNSIRRFRERLGVYKNGLRPPVKVDKENENTESVKPNQLKRNHVLASTSLLALTNKDSESSIEDRRRSECRIRPVENNKDFMKSERTMIQGSTKKVAPLHRSQLALNGTLFAAYRSQRR